MRNFQELENRVIEGTDVTDWLHAQQLLPQWTEWANVQLGLPVDTFLSTEQLLNFPGLASCYVCARDEWDSVAQLMAMAKPLGNRLQWILGNWSIIMYVDDQRIEIMDMKADVTNSERITYRQMQAILLARLA